MVPLYAASVEDVILVIDGHCNFFNDLLRPGPERHTVDRAAYDHIYEWAAPVMSPAPDPRGGFSLFPAEVDLPPDIPIIKESFGLYASCRDYAAEGKLMLYIHFHPPPDKVLQRAASVQRPKSQAHITQGPASPEQSAKPRDPKERSTAKREWSQLSHADIDKDAEPQANKSKRGKADDKSELNKSTPSEKSVTCETNAVEDVNKQGTPQRGNDETQEAGSAGEQAALGIRVSVVLDMGTPMAKRVTVDTEVRFGALRNRE